MSGAIGGGLAGYQSPGIKGLGGEKFRGFLGGDKLFGRDKVGAMGFKDLFQTEGGLKKFFLGEGDQSGLIGRGGEFFGGGTSGGSEQDFTNQINTIITEQLRNILLAEIMLWQWTYLLFVNLKY